MWLHSLAVMLALAASSEHLCAAGEEPYTRYAQPEVFSYDELQALGVRGELSPQLDEKLRAVLTTPFVSNEAYYRGAKPHRPLIDGFGPALRVAHWNIERGIQVDRIKQLFSAPREFLNSLPPAKDSAERKAVARQAEILRGADIIVLNEVDWGLKRSGYRAVISELGQALNMNWAYGIEFVEVDPINLGTEDFEGIEEAGEREKLVAEIQVDKAKLRGLHGTAILSRYPIREARLVPFETVGYDWFAGEHKRVAAIEKGKRAVAGTVFLERVSREIRRGGRTSLIATIDVPYLPEKRATVAAPHLENRTKPENRRKQMAELLTLLEENRNPVIIAGDLNTTLSDTQPTNIKREVYRRVGSSQFWANTGIKYATGVGLLYDVVKGGVNFFKNQQDPTAKDIPIVGPNPEAALFEDLEKFRFRDGTVFDFRGDKARTVNQTEGTLANSNQRDDKGFAVTYEVERTIGPAGKLKLDWIFVKSYLESPRSSGGPYRFAPHFPRTLEELNYSGEMRLSDHNPIVADLPFSEPPDLVAAPEKAIGEIEISEDPPKEKKRFRLWPFGK